MLHHSFGNWWSEHWILNRAICKHCRGSPQTLWHSGEFPSLLFAEVHAFRRLAGRRAANWQRMAALHCGWMDNEPVFLYQRAFTLACILTLPTRLSLLFGTQLKRAPWHSLIIIIMADSANEPQIDYTSLSPPHEPSPAQAPEVVQVDPLESALVTPADSNDNSLEEAGQK